MPNTVTSTESTSHILDDLKQIFFVCNAKKDIRCRICGMTFEAKFATIAIEMHTLMNICPPADK